jgi:sodium/proline symporter
MDVQHLSMLATFGGYLVLLLVIGYLGDRKHSGSYEGFVSADKSLGPWTTALSSAASSESAWAMVGLSGLGFYYGLPAIWAAIGCIFGFVVNSLFVMVQLRRDSERVGALTLSDYFELKLNDHSKMLRVVSALIITFFMGVYVVAQFVAAGRILQEMEVMGPGTSYENAVVVGATVLGIYIFMGGYAAVCWTDSVQGVLMMLVMVALPAYALYLAGGPGEVLASLEAQGALHSNLDLLGWGAGGFFFSQMAIGMGYQGMPHMVIRYITVRDEKAARQAAIISVAWGAIALTGSALLGVIARGLYPLDAAGCSVAGMCAPTQKAAEGILSFFALANLHPALAGLVLAAISAAIMSTADSQLMYAATALVNDFFLHFTSKRPGKRTLVWMTRGSIVAITAVAAAVAMQEIKVIYSFVLFAWGALGAAFTPLVLLSLYWKGLNRWGALASMVAGPTTIILWHTASIKTALVAVDPSLYSGAFELIPGCAISTIAAVVVSWAAKPRA